MKVEHSTHPTSIFKPNRDLSFLYQILDDCLAIRIQLYGVPGNILHQLIKEYLTRQFTETGTHSKIGHLLHRHLNVSTVTQQSLIPHCSDYVLQYTDHQVQQFLLARIEESTRKRTIYPLINWFGRQKLNAKRLLSTPPTLSTTQVSTFTQSWDRIIQHAHTRVSRKEYIVSRIPRLPIEFIIIGFIATLLLQINGFATPPPAFKDFFAGGDPDRRAHLDSLDPHMNLYDPKSFLTTWSFSFLLATIAVVNKLGIMQLPQIDKKELITALQAEGARYAQASTASTSSTSTVLGSILAAAKSPIPASARLLSEDEGPRKPPKVWREHKQEEVLVDKPEKKEYQDAKETQASIEINGDIYIALMATHGEPSGFYFKILARMLDTRLYNKVVATVLRHRRIHDASSTQPGIKKVGPSEQSFFPGCPYKLKLPGKEDGSLRMGISQDAPTDIEKDHFGKCAMLTLHSGIGKNK